MNEYFDILNSNGEYTNKIVSRKECHELGLWHKAVVVFILSSDNKKVLLQQRSSNKKLWPNLWDVTAGGHVLTKEFGYQAIIRETKEELGIYINKEELEFIGVTISEDIEGKIINRHFNEHYVVHEDIDIQSITLQQEEVQDIKWFNIDDVILSIDNDYKDLTRKISCWQYLKKYLEINKMI